MKFKDFKTPDQVRGFQDLADMFNGDERIPLGKQVYDLTQWFTDKGYKCIKPLAKVPTANRQAIVDFFNSDAEFQMDIDEQKDCQVLYKYKMGTTEIILACIYNVFIVNMNLVFAVQSIKVHKKYRGVMVGTMLFDKFFEFLQEGSMLKPDTDDSIIMVQVLKDKPAIEFYRKMGFNEPPLCFDSWKDKDFELLGCSIEQFKASNAYLKLAVSIFPLNSQQEKRLNDKLIKAKSFEEEKSEDSIQFVDKVSAQVVKSPSVKSPGSTKGASRHCYIGKCNGNLFDNSNWAAHYKRTHKLTKETLDHSKYFNCTGADCKHCLKNETKSVASHKDAKGKSLFKCSVCLNDKRYDLIAERDPAVICKVCAKKAIQKNVAPKKKATNKRTYTESSLSEFSHGGYTDDDDAAIEMIKQQQQQQPARLSQNVLQELPEEGMGVESKQDALVQPPEEDIDEYRGKDSIKKKSGPNKRPKGKATKTDAGDMIHSMDMDIPMADDTTTAIQTNAPAQSDIKVGDSVSVVAMSLVSQSNQDETTLVEALKQIKSATDQLKAADMIIDVCKLFTKDFAAKHISDHQCNAFTNGLLEALDGMGVLPVDKVTGLITASFVSGYSCWVSCVNVLSHINAEHRDKAIGKFSVYLNLQHCNHTAVWMKANWQYTNQQQAELIHHCKQNGVQTSDAILTPSLIVQQLDPVEFVPFALRYAENYNDQIIMINECIKRKPRQQTVSQDQLSAAIASMKSYKNVAVVESLKETLLNTPVAQWKDLIESTAAISNVTDAQSIQTFLDELQERCGEIKNLKDDITTSEDERFSLILEMCEIKPNNKQFALSQYAIGNSYNQPRQLYVVPSGQGKSRIMIGIEMIYLMSGAGSKIHVVFSSEHLMKRDQQDAADILFYIEESDTKVNCHVGIDFEPEVGALILIDEADVYMFSDPEKFRKFTSSNVCIGFTATAAMTPMEVKVQEQLNFKQYSYNIDEGAVDTYEKIAVDSVIDAPDNKTKASCIAEIAMTNPVLVYGSEELLATLNEAGINVLVVSDETDYNLLRQLDTLGEDKRYTVAFATDLNWMRGIDYRSKSLPLTLVVAKSFPSKRDALQGFNRVGRFTDQGIRARFADIPILDLVQEKQMSGQHFKFIMILNKNKVQLKPVSYRQITTTYKNKGGK